MAFIKIEGIVDKPLGDRGFIILETIRLNDGRTFEKKWKVWAIPAPEFSSFVEVTGEFSSKISEYEYQGTTKHSQDLNVNNAVVKVLRGPEVASPDVNNEWATKPTDDKAPF
jgi:hypothetical protein